VSDEDFDRAYRATPDLFGAEPEPILVRFAHTIDRSRPVLDVGCGQGRHTLWLARRGYPVVALDPSTEALEIVGSAASELPVTLRHGSFADLDPDLAPFSAICVFGLVQILNGEEQDRLIASIRTWSAPGSVLFLTAWTTDDPRHHEIAASWRETSANCYESPDGRVRSYLRPGAALDLLPGWEVLHHREGLGPWHRHGDGPRERHGVVELVLRP